MPTGADKTKLIDQAQKHILKGQIDKAITDYQMVVDADPKDLRSRLKLGELYLKANNKTAAITEYSAAADAYTSDGFNLQAIAVYKQILRIDPSITDIYIKLAKLYKKQGLVADAVSQYRIVISNYEKQGKVTDAIDALKQMTLLDPDNFSIRAKLAEIYLKNNKKKEALDEYSRIAEDLEKSGRLDDVIILYEKFLSSDSSSSEALNGLAKAYLKTGRGKDALEKLQSALKNDPDDKNTLSLLAKTYLSLDDRNKARDTYESILRIDPSSPDAGKGLMNIMIDEGEMEKAAAVALPLIDSAIALEDYDAALNILLIFYRNEVKEIRLLEKMADVYRLKGEREKEIALRNEISEITGIKKGKIQPSARAEEVSAEPVIEEIEELEELPLEEPEFIQPEEELPGAPGEDPSIYLTEAEVYEKYGLVDKAVDILNTAAKLFPDNDEVLSKLKSLAFPDKISEETPSAAEISLEVDADEEPLLETPAFEEDGYLEELEPSGEHHAEEIAGHSVAGVKKDIEEADFYIQQGLYEDAKNVCTRILESYPDNAEVLSKLKEIEDTMAASSPTLEPAEEKEEAVESFFDLAAELDSEEFEELTMPPGMREAEKFGFEDIFSEFKKGVDTQLGKEDTDTHYNLGIAYKEMGLIDDAIREFRIASADPKKEFDCLNLTGICYIEKGVPQKAVEIFKKGLELCNKGGDEYASISYELGRAYELLGMASEALSAYMESGRISPGFRDVELRIANLGGKKEPKKGRVSFV